MTPENPTRISNWTSEPAGQLQPVAVGVDQSVPLAALDLLAGVISTQARCRLDFAGGGNSGASTCHSHRSDRWGSAGRAGHALPGCRGSTSEAPRKRGASDSMESRDFKAIPVGFRDGL